MANTAPSHALERQTYRLDDLTQYHRNPRIGDVDTIAESLKTNGQYRPIVVNIGTQTGRPLEILAGNHTYQAARQLGWETIAATTVDVDDDHAARIVLADNRTSDLATMNHELLAALLDEQPDLTGTGYTTVDLEDLAAYAAPVPTLDDLANQYGERRPEDDHKRLVIDLPQDVFEAWKDHANPYDSDAEALAALLQ